nr:glycosyltransferase family 4 protein [Chitinophaga rhizophila]
MSRHQWREQHGFTDTGLLVCMLANLHVQKDHETLIKAWAKLMSNSPNIEGDYLLLAGRPQDTEEKLKRMVAEYGIENSVVFMGGVKDVHSMLAAIDISVLCAFEKSEGLPNAVLESMLHSLPVLGSDVAALHCALGAEMKAYLSPVSNAEVLADNLQKLFISAALRTELGKKNKERQQKVFSVDALIANSAKLIMNVIRH